MDSTALLNAFRQDMSDLAEPYLWSDAEIYRYLNDAYFEFVRRTGGIADASSSACVVPVVAGEATSPLDAAILRVMSAVKRSDCRAVGVANLTDLVATSASDYGQLRAQLLDDKPGPVRQMIIGTQRNLARWLAVPEADDVVDLTIYRMPFEAITRADQRLDDVEDIHHLHLLDWMKYLAFRKQDLETLSPQESARAYQAFEGYLQQVRAEWERYKHKTRVVRYGGL